MTAFPQIGDPVFVAKGRPDLARFAGRCLAAFEPRILAAVEEFVRDPDAEAFLRFEDDVLLQFLLAASHVAAGAVAFLHDDPAWVAVAVERARERASARAPRNAASPSRPAIDGGAIPRRRDLEL